MVRLHPSAPEPRRPSPAASRWAVRLGLVGFGLGLVAALELLLRLLPVGAALPASGFAGSPPLFVRETGPGGDRYVVSAPRRGSFNLQSFPAEEGEGRRLVFCIGGSAVYGYPYGAAVAFPAQLETLLRHAYPGRRFDVVNVGGMSYGSERLALLVEELVRYHPAAIVVYSGNNEFIEKGLAERADAAGWLGDVQRYASRLALYRALASLVRRPAAETDAEGAGAFGINVERREGRFVSGAERRRVVERYTANLERIVACARDHGVTPVLATVAVNLGDWQPEAATLDPRLPPDGVLSFALAAARGHALERAGNAAEALASYQAALAIDGSHAIVSYRAGRLARRLGHGGEARTLLTRALATDAAPIRVLPELDAAVRAVAARRDVPLVDVAAAVAAASPDGIPDGRLFWDYCHPDVAGHRLIATTLEPVLAHVLGLGPPATGDSGVELPKPPERAFADWWLGNVALRQGDPVTARRRCARAHELAPDDFRPLACLGAALQASGDAAGALRRFEEAARAAPRSSLVHNQLGSQLAQMRRWDRALAEFDEALRLDPGARGVHMNIGAVELAQRHLDQAATAFAAELEHSPHLARLHRNLGLAALLRGEPAAAARDFIEELRINPEDRPSAIRLAQASAAAGQRDRARLATQLALTLSPGNPALLTLARELGEPR